MNEVRLAQLARQASKVKQALLVSLVRKARAFAVVWDPRVNPDARDLQARLDQLANGNVQT